MHARTFSPYKPRSATWSRCWSWRPRPAVADLVSWFGHPSATIVLVALCVLSFRSQSARRSGNVPVAVVAGLAATSAVLGFSSYWSCHDATHPVFFQPLIWTVSLVKGGVSDFLGLHGGHVCPSPTPDASVGCAARGARRDFLRPRRCGDRVVPITGRPTAGQPRQFRHRGHWDRRRNPVHGQCDREHAEPPEHTGRRHRRSPTSPACRRPESTAAGWSRSTSTPRMRSSRCRCGATSSGST